MTDRDDGPRIVRLSHAVISVGYGENRYSSWPIRASEACRFPRSVIDPRPLLDEGNAPAREQTSRLRLLLDLASPRPRRTMPAPCDSCKGTCGGGTAACGAGCTCGPSCTCGDGKPSGGKPCCQGGKKNE
ncbi:unnamed protein product, partial [Iphiclides podalirius]